MSDAVHQPVQSARGTGGAPGAAYDQYEADRGAGWVTFAGVILMIVGTMNIIYGIAAISDSRFYGRDVTYIISNLNTYGWVLLIIGVIQVGAALSIWAGNAYGRWVGILSAGVNAIIQLLFLPSFPFASLAVFALDVLVIYGLVAYGGRRSAPA
jgi:hypothetical protein